MTPPFEHRLDSAAASVPQARGVARSAVRELGGDDDACETTALLVSELVTNAVLHGRSGVLLRVLPVSARVRVCVVDGSPARPRTRCYGLQESTGRGMRLVEGLSACWGVDADDAVATGGKQVWFEVELDSAATELDEDALLAAFDLSGLQDAF